MNDVIYTFNGKDITMNVCIQIKLVLDILKEELGVGFEDAAMLFYKSETYKTLQNTENALWAESAGYIAERYFEEKAEQVFSGEKKRDE